MPYSKYMGVTTMEKVYDICCLLQSVPLFSTLPLLFCLSNRHLSAPVPVPETDHSQYLPDSAERALAPFAAGQLSLSS